MRNINKVFAIIVLAAIIGFAYTGCDNNTSNNDLKIVTYSGTDGSTTYTLTITKYTLASDESADRAVYAPQQGDTYILSASGGEKSAGIVASVNGTNITLEPSNASGTLVVTVSGTSMTALSGTITWDNGGGAFTGPGSLGSGGEGGDYIYGQSYLDEHLTAPYRIVYSVKTYLNNNLNHDYTTEVRKVGTSWYFKGDVDSDSEEIYSWSPEENGYYCYTKNDNGNFEKLDGGVFTANQVNNYHRIIATFIRAYVVDLAYLEIPETELQKAGTETILGRSCDKYSYTFQYSTTTYSIDKATGLCMRLTTTPNGGAMKNGEEYVCTEFQTSNVTLPAYTP